MRSIPLPNDLAGSQLELLSLSSGGVGLGTLMIPAVAEVGSGIRLLPGFTSEALNLSALILAPIL